MLNSSKKIGFFLGPILCGLILILPVPATLSPEAMKVAAIAVLMAVWWTTEAIPIPATSLVPLALFPFFSVMSSKSAAAPYANHLIYLFMGGFFIAVTMEKWNLHKRIALLTISLFGTKPHRIILGFMVSTAFLSMWISNTATAMMMVPIAIAVIKEAASGIYQGNAKIADPSGPNHNFAVALMLSIAYAASIGGLGTIIGTPPNTVLVGFIEKTYGQQISFASWMAIGVPLSVVMLLITWIYLVKIGFKLGADELHGGRALIKSQIQNLGPISRAEKSILIVFLLVAAAWIGRGFIHVEALNMVHDSTIAIAGALLLFLFPVNFKEGKFLLDWQTAVKIPWGIVILFGGGLSLANGFKVTGLTIWIGKSLSALQGTDMLIILFMVVFLTIFLTEMTSNTATSTMLIPIMAGLALAMSIHPYALIIGTAMAASFAFMLPIATPPNAVVFGSGYVTIPQMVKAGLVLNLIGSVLITLVIKFILPVVWKLDLLSVPHWATQVVP